MLEAHSYYFLVNVVLKSRFSRIFEAPKTNNKIIKPNGVLSWCIAIIVNSPTQNWNLPSCFSLCSFRYLTLINIISPRLGELFQSTIKPDPELRKKYNFEVASFGVPKKLRYLLHVRNFNLRIWAMLAFEVVLWTGKI